MNIRRNSLFRVSLSKEIRYCMSFIIDNGEDIVLSIIFRKFAGGVKASLSSNSFGKSIKSFVPATKYIIIAELTLTYCKTIFSS